MLFLKEKNLNALWSCNLKFGKFHNMNRSSSRLDTGLVLTSQPNSAERERERG